LDGHHDALRQERKDSLAEGRVLDQASKDVQGVDLNRKTIIIIIAVARNKTGTQRGPWYEAE